MPYIYREINESEFVDLFDEYNRSENFSRPARRELFEYYSEIAEGHGEPFQMDVIAICCDWSEFTADELVQEYGDPAELDEDGDYFGSLLDDLHDDTVVIEVEHFEAPTTYLVAVF